MRLRSLFFSLVVGLSLVQQDVQAECHGKIDLGAARINMDYVLNGTVQQSMNLWGVSSSATIQVWKALVARPAACKAKGDSGNYFNVGSGVGCFIPVPNYEKLCFIPTIGFVYSEFDFLADASPFTNVKHSMNTWCAYAGMDVSWYVHPCVCITGGFQHAWADSDSKVFVPIGVVPGKSSSKGWNYLGQVDYYFMECWSVSVAACWMSSRSELNHGSDAVAVRSGIGYKF